MKRILIAVESSGFWYDTRIVYVLNRVNIISDIIYNICYLAIGYFTIYNIIFMIFIMVNYFMFL